MFCFIYLFNFFFYSFGLCCILSCLQCLIHMKNLQNGSLKTQKVMQKNSLGQMKVSLIYFDFLCNICLSLDKKEMMLKSYKIFITFEQFDCSLFSPPEFPWNFLQCLLNCQMLIFSFSTYVIFDIVSYQGMNLIFLKLFPHYIFSIPVQCINNFIFSFTDQLTRLRMILQPFMLRRVKKDVENELSDKVDYKQTMFVT